ncbi:MAG: hypothetical protein ACI4PQ_06685 [Butyricicoccaceae bacterium]
MGIAISTFGARAALAVLVPYLIYTIVSPRNAPRNYAGGSILLLIVERISMVACASMTALSVEMDTHRPAQIAMVVLIACYDLLLLRYFASGADFAQEFSMLLPRTALQLMLFLPVSFVLSDGLMSKMLLVLAVGTLGNSGLKLVQMAGSFRRAKQTRRRRKNGHAAAMSCSAAKRRTPAKQRTQRRTQSGRQTGRRHR